MKLSFINFTRNGVINLVVFLFDKIWDGFRFLVLCNRNRSGRSCSATVTGGNVVIIAIAVRKSDVR